MIPDQARMIADYRLENQIGFILRKALQYHATIFSEKMPYNLTRTQFAILAKLFELGKCSQNKLGRLVDVDGVTTKGVIGRLRDHGYLMTTPDCEDKRRLILCLTDLGEQVASKAILAAGEVTQETLKPLTKAEGDLLFELLGKLA